VTVRDRTKRAMAMRPQLSIAASRKWVDLQRSQKTFEITGLRWPTKFACQKQAALTVALELSAQPQE